MNDKFRIIWEMALPYQDKRDDKGHAEVTTQYARLLVELEGGDKDIIIPAMILHDIGWSTVPREEWMVIFNPDATQDEKTAIQLKHQSAGVKLA